MARAKGIVWSHDSMIAFSPGRTFRYLVTTLRAAARTRGEGASLMAGEARVGPFLNPAEGASWFPARGTATQESRAGEAGIRTTTADLRQLPAPTGVDLILLPRRRVDRPCAESTRDLDSNPVRGERARTRAKGSKVLRGRRRAIALGDGAPLPRWLGGRTGCRSAPTPSGSSSGDSDDSGAPSL